IRGCQTVKECGFTGVGIAHQGDGCNFCTLPGAAPLVALPAHFFKAFLQSADAIPYQAAVGFQLGFTGPTHTDTTLLALEVSPAAHQTCSHKIELGKFHLELALIGSRTLGKNIENEAGTIKNPAFKEGFKIALLAGRQAVIKDNNLGAVFV